MKKKINKAPKSLEASTCFQAFLGFSVQKSQMLLFAIVIAVKAVKIRSDFLKRKGDFNEFFQKNNGIIS
ncbi:hypothetical protein CJ483_08115 [Bacillus sp. PK3_68]|nr:hypothetical protein CJ483_08115 [Bacillus sp. PK3_68]